MSAGYGVNDFVVRFANVNGTGSASANTMFAKSIFRSGVPVSAKNIFPSISRDFLHGMKCASAAKDI
jgi:hypothetical protein